MRPLFDGRMVVVVINHLGADRGGIRDHIDIPCNGGDGHVAAVLPVFFVLVWIIPNTDPDGIVRALAVPGVGMAVVTP